MNKLVEPEAIKAFIEFIGNSILVDTMLILM
jgi:hypothetical protein